MKFKLIDQIININKSSLKSLKISWSIQDGKILFFHRPVESRESSLVIDKFVFLFTKKEIQ